MKIYKVAVFPAGTEIGLEVCSSLSNQKNIKLYVTGCDVVEFEHKAELILKEH